jgi:hypothetical protein
MEVTNFTPRLLNCRKESQYPLNRTLGRNQNRSGGITEDNALLFLGLEAQTFHLVMCRYTDYTVPARSHVAYSLIQCRYKERSTKACKCLITCNFDELKYC